MNKLFNTLQKCGWLFAVLISIAIPMHAYTFHTNKNKIALTIVDCADAPDTVLFYTHNNRNNRQNDTNTRNITGRTRAQWRPVTAGEFMQNDAHPLRVTVTNNSKVPVQINPASILLAQYDIGIASTFSKYRLACTALAGTALTALIAWLYASYGGHRVRSVCFIGASLTLSAVSSMLATERERKILRQHILHQPITVEPGKTVETIILLNCADYKRLFNFRVFNHDATDIAVLFDVDLRAS